jgi:hypothetical protein
LIKACQGRMANKKISVYYYPKVLNKIKVLNKQELKKILAIIAFKFCGVCFKVKGQIEPKADWRTMNSPKKRMNEFVLFHFLLFIAINFYIELCTKHLWRP